MKKTPIRTNGCPVCKKPGGRVVAKIYNRIGEDGRRTVVQRVKCSGCGQLYTRTNVFQEGKP